MCLIHEKIVKKEIKDATIERQSRHLYDTVEMAANKAILNQVLNNTELYNIIINPRKNWIRLKGIEYDTLQTQSINFVPSEDLIDYFKKDYEKMQKGMIYEECPTFIEIMNGIKSDEYTSQ